MLTLPADGLANNIGRLLSPHEGCGVEIPVVDVVANVLGQRADRIEGAAANRLAGQDAEPGFDHVQPRGPRGCEMKLHSRMLFEPGLDGRSGMSRGVVDNDVQLLFPVMPRQPFDKAQEIGSRVTGATLSHHGAGGHFQCRIQAGEPVAPIVMGLAGRQAESQGKQGLCAAEGLNLCFLVHAQDDGVVGRVQIESDHVIDLVFGLGVGAELEGFDPVGLERMGFPDAMHRAVRQTELLGQIPRTPVSHPRRWRFQRHGHHLGGLSGLDGAGTAASGSIRQTGQAGFGKATPDAAHLDGGVTGPSGHFGARDMIGDQQHGSCTPAESGGTRRGPLQSLQFPPVAWRQDNGTRMVGHATSRKGSIHGLYINIT